MAELENKIITFGRYKGEDIRWIVLDYDDYKMILLSEKAIDCMCYHDTLEDITWRDSSIRYWLNNDFYNEAFSDAEKEKIRRSPVKSDLNPYYNTSPGIITADHVYLLSMVDTEKYINYKDYRKCYPTDYTLSKGVEKTSIAGCHWWLRTPGEEQNKAVFYHGFGLVKYAGTLVNTDKYGVRPAISIYYDESYFKDEKEPIKEVKKVITPKNRALKLEISDEKLKFGYYKQNNDNEEPISWRILAHEDNKFLIISEDALDCVNYHNEKVDVTWENSNIRKWLNSDFMNTAFSIEEQKIILTSKVTADYNELAKQDNQGNDTMDQVFLLSINERKKYFIDDNDARCIATPYAQKQGVFVRSVVKFKYCSWWLRTMGSDNLSPCSVFESGSDSAFGSSRNDNNTGVRPAMWIKIDDKSLLDKMLKLAFKQEKYIHFGKYPQNTDKPEMIKWRVLAREDKKALIISDSILVSRPFQKYASSGDAITWKISELRKWLNKTFINEVFSSDEQKRILTTNVILKEKKKDAPILEVTEDKLFLLNMDEAEKYFRDYKDRQSKATLFAKNDYIYVDDNGNSPWWLNSIPSKKGKSAEVQPSGLINDYGNLMSSNVGIRPTLWISLKDDKEIEKDYLAVLKKEEERFITFGKYLQSSTKKENIKWRILARDNDKALIISEKGLDIKPFNIKYVYKTWEESDIRRWLNDEFLDGVFSLDERQRILLSTVTADKNPQYDTNPGNDTLDYVFLLSINEVEKYFDNDLECTLTKYAHDKVTYEADREFYNWWLRTPGWSETNVSYVSDIGKIYDKGTFINMDSSTAIRPALWISLKPTNNKAKKVVKANTEAK